VESLRQKHPTSLVHSIRSHFSTTTLVGGLTFVLGVFVAILLHAPEHHEFQDTFVHCLRNANSIAEIGARLALCTTLIPLLVILDWLFSNIGELLVCCQFDSMILVIIGSIFCGTMLIVILHIVIWLREVVFWRTSRIALYHRLGE